mmetsp:Transcript_100596/g.284973  ORF Transcript_100596/g.284973 Transcript_100596/m.284973 type:complete len:219 (-) Transcript_100596:90-746(-)
MIWPLTARSLSTYFCGSLVTTSGIFVTFFWGFGLAFTHPRMELKMESNMLTSVFGGGSSFGIFSTSQTSPNAPLPRKPSPFLPTLVSGVNSPVSAVGKTSCPPSSSAPASGLGSSARTSSWAPARGRQWPGKSGGMPSLMGAKPRYSSSRNWSKTTSPTRWPRRPRTEARAAASAPWAMVLTLALTLSSRSASPRTTKRARMPATSMAESTGKRKNRG